MSYHLPPGNPLSGPPFSIFVPHTPPIAFLQYFWLFFNNYMTTLQPYCFMDYARRSSLFSFDDAIYNGATIPVHFDNRCPMKQLLPLPNQHMVPSPHLPTRPTFLQLPLFLKAKHISLDAYKFLRYLLNNGLLGWSSMGYDKILNLAEGNTLSMNKMLNALFSLWWHPPPWPNKWQDKRYSIKDSHQCIQVGKILCYALHQCLAKPWHQSPSDYLWDLRLASEMAQTFEHQYEPPISDTELRSIFLHLFPQHYQNPYPTECLCHSWTQQPLWQFMNS